jgi:hypothetical protein
MLQGNFVKIFNSTQMFKNVSCLTVLINIKNLLNYMCLRRAPEKYITGAALDRAALQQGTNAHGGWWKQNFDLKGRNNRRLEKFRHLYFQPCRMKKIKSTRIRWAGNGAFRGNKRNEYKFFLKACSEETT